MLLVEIATKSMMRSARMVRWLERVSVDLHGCGRSLKPVGGIKRLGAIGKGETCYPE